MVGKRIEGFESLGKKVGNQGKDHSGFKRSFGGGIRTRNRVEDTVGGYPAAIFFFFPVNKRLILFRCSVSSAISCYL